MERLFLYYNGPRQQEVRNRYLKQISPESIYSLNNNELVVNYFAGEFNTAGYHSSQHFKIWMHGIFVHKDKGISVSIDEQSFKEAISESEGPEDIASLFVNGSYCGLIKMDDKTYFFNDFMGMQPLYYYNKNGEWIISSSFRFLLQMVAVDVDKTALAEYVLTGCIYSQKTVASQIKSLGPSSLMEISRGQEPKIRHYNNYAEQGEIRGELPEIAEEIADRFIKAVRRLYDPRIRYSFSITGGVDSRLIYLEWPDRENLLTETAGEGSSDYLKAAQLIRRLGNPGLHVLEDHKREYYAEGIDSYYHNCDNPLRVVGDFNLHHLEWKLSRGSFLHMSGVGGEHLDGENLYLSRNKQYVIREALLPYAYHELREADKPALLSNVLGIRNKQGNSAFLLSDYLNDFYVSSIVAALDSFIGKTKYQETYTERIRTYHWANTAYNMTGSQNLSRYLTIMPYCDTELVRAVSKYHPESRELRKLTIRMLSRYKEVADIPIDTTHLRINAPYPLHKFFRVLRMVMNIGYHKKVPFIQKGLPPKFRAFPYFDKDRDDFRQLVHARLTGCDWFDKGQISDFLGKVSHEEGYNFYLRHGTETNIMLLLRMSYMHDILKSAKTG